MLKKATLSSTYSGLQCCICSHASTGNTSPFALPPQRARPRGSRKRPSPLRSYATVRGSIGPDFRDNMNWPCSKVRNAAPTPYEIFELEKGGLYSKHKFYELVKIYHPDRHEHTTCEGITHIEKLERYRLVVQAHEILSDPVKRRAYDSYGAGWGENARNITKHSRGFSSSAESGKTYGFGPNDDSSPFANATWEDWERWYRRSEDPNTKQAYTGTYINPNAFASFVILMAVISGVAQATRAGQYSGSLEEKTKAFTEETSRFLTTRQEQYNETGLKSDGRIKQFLEKRDPTRYGLKDEEEEHYRKHFGGERIPPPKARPKVVEPD